jgi:hypothetical protein
LAQLDLEAACDLFIERCILEVANKFDPGLARETLEEKFAELDLQAETRVQLVCPSCGAMTSILVDASALVFERLASTTRLLNEVDTIARCYHWSERDILALPTARRRAYLQRVADGVPVG